MGDVSEAESCGFLSAFTREQLEEGAVTGVLPDVFDVSDLSFPNLSSITLDGEGEMDLDAVPLMDEDDPLNASSATLNDSLMIDVLNDSTVHNVPPVDGATEYFVNRMGAQVKKHPCPFCAKPYSNNYSRARHVRNVHGDEYKESDSYKIRKSRSLAAGSSGKVSLQCKECGKQLSSRETYFKHMKGQHYNSYIAPYKCPHPGCALRFDLQRLMIAHHNSAHSLGKKVVKSKPPLAIVLTAQPVFKKPTARPPPVNPLVCVPCHIELGTPLKHTMHKLRHCPTCTQLIKNKDDLEAHVASEHGGQAMCTRCRTTLASPALLDKHKRGCGGRWFSCFYCKGKNYSSVVLRDAHEHEKHSFPN